MKQVTHPPKIFLLPYPPYAVYIASTDDYAHSNLRLEQWDW